MNIAKATRRYEKWLAQHTRLVKADLRFKHARMSESAFQFLRATYYRWLQTVPRACSGSFAAPPVMAVGDVHLENFGTWRDLEGRLIWGVNDFDEVSILPYTNDLLRLAVSARLASQDLVLALNGKRACEAICEGYRDSLEVGGQAFVLAEDHAWLRGIVQNKLRDPVRFWKRLDALPTLRRAIPPEARDALEYLLPVRGMPYRVVHRVAGLGSLGHHRLVAIADFHGAQIAREAKAMVPPCAGWSDSAKPAQILCQKIMDHAVRCPDPFLHLRGSWIVRRLSPDCSRVEWQTIPSEQDELRLLYSMGWELGNIHLGSKDAVQKVRAHLKRQKSDWLDSASKSVAKLVIADWKDWKKRGEL